MPTVLATDGWFFHYHNACGSYSGDCSLSVINVMRCFDDWTTRRMTAVPGHSLR